MKVKANVIFLGQVAPNNAGGQWRLKLFDIDAVNELEILYPGELKANPGENLGYEGDIVVKRGKFGVYITAEGEFKRNGAGGSR